MEVVRFCLLEIKSVTRHYIYICIHTRVYIRTHGCAVTVIAFVCYYYCFFFFSPTFFFIFFLLPSTTRMKYNFSRKQSFFRIAKHVYHARAWVCYVPDTIRPRVVYGHRTHTHTHTQQSNYRKSMQKNKKNFEFLRLALGSVRLFEAYLRTRFLTETMLKCAQLKYSARAYLEFVCRCLKSDIKNNKT